MNVTKKIIVFDDNIDILDIFSFILSSKNYEIKTFENTENVEEKIKDFMPDLIFMDNYLPGIGGMEATKLLKKNADLKHIPIIYFSASNQISEFALQAGADGFLTKPFDIDSLEKLVENFTSKS